MHFESLDSRRLMAVGLDTTFAGDGTLNKATSTSFLGESISTPVGLFVEQEGRQRYIYKYDRNGNLDTRWGVGGRAEIGFDVSELAYDAKTGDLYAGGVGTRTDGTRSTVAVQRFLASGQSDARFGAAGVVTYSIAAPPGNPIDSDRPSVRYDARLTLHQIVPLAGRQVLVGFAQGITKYVDNGISGETTTEGSTGLLRFRYNGLADNTFGRRGYAVVSGNSGSSSYADFNFPSSADTLTITDIDVLKNGSYRVVGVREERDGQEPQNEVFYNTGVQIKSRLVTTAGQLSTTEAYSWTLQTKLPGHTNSDPVTNDFETLLAESDGGTSVTAIGRTKNGSVTRPLVAYKLTPGVRPAASTPFSDTGIVATQAIRSPYGFYYVRDNTGRVARYRPDFRRDVGFAARGAGVSDATSITDLTADINGNVLVVGSDRIERLG